MTTDTAGDSPSMRLGSVTVTYHPDLGVLDAQLRALPESTVKIIVDNASPPDTLCELQELQQRLPGVHLLRNDGNAGLAAALDQGVRALAARSPPSTHVLLLDQDSEPHPGSVERLQHAWRQLQDRGAGPVAVGPQLLDPDTGLMHGFHCMRGWRWSRVFPRPGDAAPSVTNLNGSGTLMRIDDYVALGGLERELFIDHVDTEWAFRMLAAGCTLWGVPDAVFTHRMGERGLRVWLLGWRIWPARSPARHRYLFRNTLWLMRRDYVPRTWKFWAAVKLLLTLVVHAVFDPRRGEQVHAMAQGLRDGVRRRRGGAP